MSEEIKKITEEELTKIQEGQSSMSALISQVGALEAQKQDVLNKIPAVKNTMEELKKQLEEAYGPININVTDGTYTDIPVENLKKVD
jgi:predicted RNase H-like nuclease (RuvC/YqgF family)